MAQHLVPTTYDEVVEKYGALIRWALRRVFRSARLSSDEFADVEQDVYLRVVEKDFLARCHAYAATQQTYSFTTSLNKLASRVAIGHLRKKYVRRRVFSMDATSVPGVWNEHTGRLASDLGSEARATESQPLTALRVARVRRHLDAVPFASGTVGDLLDLAQDDNLTAASVAQLGGRVRWARRRLRALGATLETGA